MNATEEEKNEDVSVCARYTKYPQWDSVLETQFLEDLVNCYPNTSGLDLELYFETDLDDGGDQSRPLLQTPTWSLSLLEGDRLTPVKPVIIPIVQSSKKKRKTSGESLGKSKLVKTSHYSNPEDWSDLYLMQDLSGERVRDYGSSSDLSTYTSSEDDEDEYTEDEVEQTGEGPSKAPVSDAIRRKIEQAPKTDRRLLKFRLEKHSWKKYSQPEKVRNVHHCAIILKPLILQESLLE